MMSAYSEDLRRRIVSSVEAGMPKAQAARTFSVSLSSVKRYDEKAMKLLEEDLKERPFATLRERCEYVRVVAGLSVSRSTVCRAIARMGPTRKKGGVSPPSATSS